MHNITKKHLPMKTQYVLWYLTLLDNLPSINDGVDDSDCPVDDCHECDRIKSCELLQQILIPAQAFIIECNDYDAAKRAITDLMNNSLVISIFLVKIETHVGYIYKGHDKNIFLRDLVPFVQDTYISATNGTPLVINTIEDIRDCGWNTYSNVMN